MKPLPLVAAILVLGLAGAVFLLVPRGPQITLTDAVLSPMGEGLMLTLKIDNPDGPDRLSAVGSPEAAQVMVMGAPFAAGLPIPGGGTPSLAGDGVHGMLMGVGDASEGRLVPITLTFEKAGEVSARARVSAAAMDHDAAYAVPPDEPEPTIELDLRPDGDGWTVEALTTNFRFDADAADGPHQPGIGHGHLYLDGLKLQRLYQPTARIGALLPGEYEVRVTLNTNDHRAYLVEGAPVSATARITVD